MSTKYHQFCPLAKATELLGEKWTFLIVREMLMGARRFGELQRGLAKISPTMLSRRLDEMVHNGLIVKVRIHNQRGYEYALTPAGKELYPVIKQLGDWGMKWARGQMADTELDVELLILYLARSIKPDQLINHETIIQFIFTDLQKLGTWWVVVKGKEVEVCLEDPRREVDAWFRTDLRTMIEIWMGDNTYDSAIRTGRLKLIGPSTLTRNVTRWMSNSIFAGIPSARQI